MAITAVGIGVGAATAAAGAAIGTIAVLGTTISLVSIGVGIAISAAIGGLVRQLAPKPPTPTFGGGGGLAQFSRDRTVAVRQAITTARIIHGRMRAAGPIVFLESSGDDNEFLHMVVTVGVAGPYEEIGDVWLDDDIITDAMLDGSGNVTTGKYSGFVRIKKHLGAHDQTADSDLVSETSATSNFKGGGCAYVYVRLKYDQDVFLQMPNVSAVVKGRKIYDMRGSPTEDPDDPDTWHWTDNASLVSLDYIRGIAAKIGNGTVVRRFGLNVDDSVIGMDAFSDAADTSDEAVALSGSPETQELRYTANGVIDTADSPAQIIEDLRTSFAGDFLYSGGEWSIIAGSFTAATVTLTADDFRGPIRMQTRVSRRELFNAVKGVFVSPDHSWQPTDYPPITDTDYETEDNDRRIWLDFPQPFQTRPAASQRIAKAELERARRQITIRVPCKLTAFRIRAGDTIAITYPRFGWDNKPFYVTRWQLAAESDDEGVPYLGVDLEAREYDSTVYAWTAEEQAIAPPAASNLPDPFTVANPTSVVVATLTSITNQGDTIHQIAVSWAAPADQFVLSGGQIEVQWKLSSASAWQPSFFVAGSITQVIISAMLEVGVSVDVRLRSVNGLGVRASTFQMIENYVIGSSQEGVDAQVDYRFITESIGSPDSIVDYGEIEGSPTEPLNLILVPSDFTDSAWDKTGLNAVFEGSPASDAATAADGTSIAQLITETTADGSPDEARSVSYAITLSASETVYKASIFVRPFDGSPGSPRNVRLAVGSGSNGVFANFNPAGGSPTDDAILSLAQAFGSGWSAYGEEAVDLGNGWFRFAIWFDTGGETDAAMELALLDGEERFYAGDGESGAYIWHAQLEKFAVVSGSPNELSRVDYGDIS